MVVITWTTICITITLCTTKHLCSYISYHTKYHTVTLHAAREGAICCPHDWFPAGSPSSWVLWPLQQSSWKTPVCRSDVLRQQIYNQKGMLSNVSYVRITECEEVANCDFTEAHRSNHFYLISTHIYHPQRSGRSTHNYGLLFSWVDINFCTVQMVKQGNRQGRS